MDVQLFVDPINDPPFIHVPEFIILKSNEDESLIYDPERDKFEFSIGDPDLDGFPGMLLLLLLGTEVTSSFAETKKIPYLERKCWF